MKKNVYLGGDIMSKGSNLARQEEYDKFVERGYDVDVYSPIMNKSINDKCNVTEEENNHLAEKIVQADTDRLWNSDIVVMCPEQNAIGSVTETGILYGWKYMANKLIDIYTDPTLTPSETYLRVAKELNRIKNQKDYYHYFDIRTNHLNEKDWRRSFSINQFLYGAVLESTASDNPEGFDTFDEILDRLDEILDKQEIDVEETTKSDKDIDSNCCGVRREYDPGHESYIYYKIYNDGRMEKINE